MGCYICNEKLLYHENPKIMECSICHKKTETNQWCKNGHYICFDCFYPLSLEREEQREREEAERVRTFTPLDVDLDKLRRTLDFYEKNSEVANIDGLLYPKEYYEIFRLLPLDMSCIEYVAALLKSTEKSIDDIDFDHLSLRDIIALISYMDVQDRIEDTTSYFIRNGIALKILRRLGALCMNKIQYKKLTEKELDTFIHMRINQLREEGAAEDIDLVPALRDYYKRHMADGTFVSWLALDGKKIVGTSGMSFVEKPPYFGCPTGRIGLLSSMFTDPDYRRRGIARELLSKVVEEARKYGCGTVQITASDMGVKLYSAYGFSHNGNFMQYKL